MENWSIKIESLLLSPKWKKTKDYKYHSAFISVWQSQEMELFTLGMKLVIFLKSESPTSLYNNIDTEARLTVLPLFSVWFEERNESIDFLAGEVVRSSYLHLSLVSSSLTLTAYFTWLFTTSSNPSKIFFCFWVLPTDH